MNCVPYVEDNDRTFAMVGLDDQRLRKSCVMHFILCTFCEKIIAQEFFIPKTSTPFVVKSIQEKPFASHQSGIQPLKNSKLLTSVLF